MIVEGGGGWMQPELRAEAWQMISEEMLDAAQYPAQVLKAAVTLLRARIDQDLAEGEEVYDPHVPGYLMLTWVQPLRAYTAEEIAAHEDEAED